MRVKVKVTYFKQTGKWYASGKVLISTENGTDYIYEEALKQSPGISGTCENFHTLVKFKWYYVGLNKYEEPEQVYYTEQRLFPATDIDE